MNIDEVSTLNLTKKYNKKKFQSSFFISCEAVLFTLLAMKFLWWNRGIKGTRKTHSIGIERKCKIYENTIFFCPSAMFNFLIYYQYRRIEKFSVSQLDETNQFATLIHLQNIRIKSAIEWITRNNFNFIYLSFFQFSSLSLSHIVKVNQVENLKVSYSIFYTLLLSIVIDVMQNEEKRTEIHLVESYAHIHLYCYSFTARWISSARFVSGKIVLWIYHQFSSVSSLSEPTIIHTPSPSSHQ